MSLMRWLFSGYSSLVGFMDMVLNTSHQEETEKKITERSDSSAPNEMSRSGISTSKHFMMFSCISLYPFYLFPEND